MTYKAKAKTKIIRAEIGLTLPVADRYYKFTVSQEREMPVSGADLKKEMACLWADGKEQINLQVEDLCKKLDYKFKKLL